MKSIHVADKSLSANLLVMNVMSDRAALNCHIDTIHKTFSRELGTRAGDIQSGGGCGGNRTE